MIVMVGGCVYKRFFMGAKGWEQVPVLKYYKEFGNLEAVSVPSLLMLPVMMAVSRD